MDNDRNMLMIPYRAKDLNVKEPIVDEKAKNKVVKEISSAWTGTTYIDNKGWLWVDIEKLHSILRTRKSNIEHIVMKIEESYKMNADNKTYIRGFKVLSMIAKAIEEGGVGTKGVYLGVSRQYYDCINDCNEVKNLRLEYDKLLSEERKKLKGKRKKKYKIKNDELTGEKLRWGAEFSHIRSVALYKELADFIENGLLVNKETHKLITEKAINDEYELKELCKDENWNLDWYDKFIKNTLINNMNI